MCSRFLLCILTLVIVATGTPGVSAQSLDPGWVGTWKMNIAKSTYSPGPPPAAPVATTTTYEIVNGVMRLTIDTVNAQGGKAQVVRYVHFDNKEHGQVSSNPSAAPTTYVYRWVDAYTFEWVGSVGGNARMNTRLVLSPDGKTQTLTLTRSDAEGQVRAAAGLGAGGAVNNVVVYEKQ